MYDGRVRCTVGVIEMNEDDDDEEEEEENDDDGDGGVYVNGGSDGDE